MNSIVYWTNMFETIVVVGGTCVVLPIIIVWLIVKARTQKMNRKMDILMKAVESGQQVDPALLVTAEEGGGKYKLKKNLLNKLLVGVFATLSGFMVLITPCIIKSFTWEHSRGFIMFPIIVMCLGIGFLVSYFVGRKMLAKEIEAEEAEMTQKK